LDPYLDDAHRLARDEVLRVGLIAEVIRAGEVRATRRDVALRPVARERPVEVRPNDASELALLGVLSLDLSRDIGELAREVERLSLVVERDSLSPELADLVLAQVIPEVARRRARPDLDRPEAAVARAVPQKLVVVGRAEKYALAGI